ncbi:MAG: LPXTG cell wall anchor domain-containing protein [Actinomycetaceae bacterium]|nr:LPXTG cell wall anchor domain-containing protein [Actinomycetaceae bacterium]
MKTRFMKATAIAGMLALAASPAIANEANPVPEPAPGNGNGVAADQVAPKPLAVVPFNATSVGPQGERQSGTPLIKREGKTISPSAEHPATFVSPSGEDIPDRKIPANKGGEVVGTYTLVPETGQVFFDPTPNFVGTADPVSVKLRDEFNQSAIATYTPTVVATRLEVQNATSEGAPGQPQTGKPTFSFNGQAVEPSAARPAALLDEKNEPKEDTQIPATKNGKAIGTYTIVPATGVVTFQPNADFVGVADPAKVLLLDEENRFGIGLYTPTVRGKVQEPEVDMQPGDDVPKQPEVDPMKPDVPKAPEAGAPGDVPKQPEVDPMKPGGDAPKAPEVKPDVPKAPEAGAPGDVPKQPEVDPMKPGGDAPKAPEMKPEMKPDAPKAPKAPEKKPEAKAELPKTGTGELLALSGFAGLLALIGTAAVSLGRRFRN